MLPNRELSPALLASFPPNLCGCNPMPGPRARKGCDTALLLLRDALVDLVYVVCITVPLLMKLAVDMLAGVMLVLLR